MANQADWPSVEAALDEILALPEQHWPSACARIAGDDQALLEELQSLLSFAGGADAVLDHPVRSGGPSEASESLIAAGTRIGAYRIVGLIGRGGMGEVYRAERADGQFDQQVALKLIQRGSPEHVARFDTERRILARLEHPNIARLFDGGITEDGRPYMIMELIEGAPILEYCREARAELGERLRLFAAILKAVAYAHQNLIVHRDLKPGNVLVTRDGTVKLLDFGVAKLLNGAEGNQTRNVPMTFAYAAPEQLTGGAITTATDVYALGLLCFELLCGRLPWGHGELSFSEALDNTLRRDPGAPSRFAAEFPGAPVAARQLRGDLDSIVLKALKKLPAERYVSAERLAQDIFAYQHGEPVAAQPDSRRYRLRKFFARHRLGVTAAAAILLAVIGGAGVAWWQAQRALAEAQRARAVQKFVIGLFKGNRPDEARGHVLTARELLVRGTEQIDRDLRSQPLALAEMHSDLADMYEEMDDNQSGMVEVQRALAVYQQVGAERSESGIEALFRRGTLYLQNRQWQPAQADLERCLAWGREEFGASNRWAVAAREKLADLAMLQDHPSEALRIAQEALAQPVGPDPADDAVRRLRVRGIIGQLQTDQGHYAAARETLSAVLKDSEGIAGYDIIDRFTYRIILARAMHYGGDAEGAEQLTRALVPEMDEALGPSHERTVIARSLRVQALGALGRYEEAAAIERDNLANMQKNPSHSEESIAMERMVLANQLKLEGQFREARTIAESILTYFDAHYASHTLDSEYIRKVAGEVVIGDGELRAGTALIRTAASNAPALEGFVNTPDEAGMALATGEADRLNGDWLGAAERLGRSCTVLRMITEPTSLEYLRCQAELAWINAMATPRDSGPAAAFTAAADRYRARLPSGHIAAADLDLMQCELDQAAGHANALTRNAAAARWRALMHRDPPPRFLFLH